MIVECAAIKGIATCEHEEEVSETGQLEVRYTAPAEPGKDMLEIRVHDRESGEVDLQLVKIEILDN